MDTITFREWDSCFFSQKIGEVKETINQSNADKIIQEKENKKYELLYYFQDVSFPLDIASLNKLNFNYIDTHATLSIDLNKIEEVENRSAKVTPIQDSKNLNLQAIDELVQGLVKVSRFYLDSQISKKKVNELYSHWIKESFQGAMADFFYLLGEPDQPEGFVTFKKINEEEINLSLITIHPEKRKEGLGKFLIASALSKLKGEFLRCSVKVSTSNIKAMNMYSSLGFRIKEQNFIFHSHFKNSTENINFNQPLVLGEEIEHIKKSLTDKNLCGNGPYTQKCQQLIENKFGVKKTLLTTSCTKGIEMAYILCNLQPGDEVIMPSFGFVSVASSLMIQHAKPVFVDVRKDTLNIDESQIEQAITPKTKAILVVHYAGVACEMDKIMEIAKRHNLFVIEDAAQAINSTYHGKYLGTIGDIGCYSFHETKNITCGEGGAININNSSLIERAEIVWEKGTNRKKFHAGIVDKYTWVDIGSSYLLADILAAFLYPQLDRIDEITQKRKQIYEYYHKNLIELEQKGLITLPVIPPECQSNYHLFHVILPSEEKRDRVLKELRKRGINAVFHFVPLHTSLMGEKLDCSKKILPITEDVSSRLIRFPFYYHLTQKEQDCIISNFKEIILNDESSKV